MSSKVILAEDLAALADGSEYPLAPGCIVSDLAREEAEKRAIRFVETDGGRIALGSDHGGFRMKEEVKAHLKELGYRVHDFGAFDEEPVDYPDLALLVARAVSRRQCRLGIVVDGAGIGSCMAANKVPGVLAAMCHDEATARNSREHNYANVLTLGGRMITTEAMKRIVTVWLNTPYGEERHRRRVDKIRAIEKGQEWT